MIRAFMELSEWLQSNHITPESISVVIKTEERTAAQIATALRREANQYSSTFSYTPMHVGSIVGIPFTVESAPQPCPECGAYPERQRTGGSAVSAETWRKINYDV